MTKIRELREARELKSIDLAFSIKIHPAQLSQIERGRLAASTRAKEALCSFFGVTGSELFNENQIAI